MSLAFGAFRVELTQVGHVLIGCDGRSLVCSVTPIHGGYYAVQKSQGPMGLRLNLIELEVQDIICHLNNMLD